jgi:hypothetical protein
MARGAGWCASCDVPYMVKVVYWCKDEEHAQGDWYEVSGSAAAHSAGLAVDHGAIQCHLSASQSMQWPLAT